jgi:hypothetical protein
MKNTLKDATTIFVNDEVFGMNAHTEFAPGFLEGTRFFVVAETEDGFRFRHNHTFCSGTLEANEDGFEAWFQDRNVDATAAETLVARINACLAHGGALDPSQWTAIQGAYGSRGWDEMAEMELEREEEFSTSLW